MTRVLLNQKNRSTLASKLPQREKNARNNLGRETERGFIEQEESRARDQRTTNRQHLLLAAAQRTGHLQASLREGREAPQHIFNIAIDRGIVAHVGAHTQVIEHGHSLKDRAALRHMADAEPDNLVRRAAHDAAAFELDVAGVWLQQAGNGLEQRGLACTIGTDQRDDLPLQDLESKIVQHLDFAVARTQVLYA